MTEVLRNERQAQRQRERRQAEAGVSEVKKITNIEDFKFAEGLVRPFTGDEPFTAQFHHIQRGFTVAAMKESKPRDTVEMMLTTQMAEIHLAFNRFAGVLSSTDHPRDMERAECAMGRLSRTFSQLAERLDKHRNAGKQTVTVQYVNVSDGGNAVVGQISNQPQEEFVGPAQARAARKAKVIEAVPNKRKG